MSSDISMSPTFVDRAAAASSSSPERQPSRRKITYVFIHPPSSDDPVWVVLSGGGTLVDRADERRHEGPFVPPDFTDREPTGLEGAEQVAVAVASARDRPPRPVQAILPAR